MLKVITIIIFHIKQICYFWTSPDGQHRNQIDYILCCQRWRSSIQSAKTRPGADCGSGHELLIAKFRLKLKKVGNTTRPFRHDLNQIPYDYTGITIALTIWTFVGKVTSLLFNMLCRFVIIFLPRSKRLFISWMQSPSAVILEPPK